MKLKLIYNTLLVLLTFSLPVISQVQPHEVETDFNDDYSFIKIDTTNPDNIWQIGPPQKTIFNEAHTPPNVIITDTINPYPPNNHSTFQFTVTSPDTGFCWSHSILDISHKLDTDSLLSGGYIEISYNGINWQNIVYDQQPGLYTHSADFYSYDDTIRKGIPAFSGSHIPFYQGWGASQFRWERVDSIAKIDSILLRFNFLSDTIETQKEGWMIDHLYFSVFNFCTNDIKKISSQRYIRVFPKPATSFIIFNVNNYILPYDLKIIELSGKTVKKIKKISNKQFEIDCNNLLPGLYFYSINSKRFVETGTLIIN